MTHLDHSGTFHGVGQGLFHSASISGSRGPFTYVYDCGAMGDRLELNHEIDRFASDHDGILDLLIVSHLHHDHVSGLPRLLKALPGVDTIILPYLFPAERTIVMHQSRWRGFRDAGPSWYREFMRSPARVLLQESNVRRLILIRGDSTSLPPSPEETPPPPPEDNPETERNRLRPMPQARIEQLLRQDGDLRSQEAQTGDRLVVAQPAGVYLGPSAYPLGGDFEFFQKAPLDDNMNAFQAAFRNALQFETVGKLLSHPDLITRFKGVYGKLFPKGSLNDTSLAVFAGVRSSTMGGCHDLSLSLSMMSPGAQSHALSHNQRYHSCDGDKHGLLLTGDLTLATQRLFREMMKHFGLERSGSTVPLYQLPHHGSCYNWNRLQAEFPYRVNYVASSASTGKHPHDAVVRAVTERGHLLACANEEQSVAYRLRHRVP